MDSIELPQYHIAYGLLPYKRNQDVIRVHKRGNDSYIVCVVDGWNDTTNISGDDAGRTVAELVAQKFPRAFQAAIGKDENKRARRAVFSLNESIEKQYPRYASCVASFLIHTGQKDDVIVSVGDVETHLWDGSQWYKPKEIRDHWIDPTKYPSNVSRFFGCFERYIYPEFSCEPDVMTIPSGKPLLIATDGIKDILSLSDINALPVNPTKQSPKAIIEAILQEVTRRDAQRDDISILARVWS